MPSPSRTCHHIPADLLIPPCVQVSDNTGGPIAGPWQLILPAGLKLGQPGVYSYSTSNVAGDSGTISLSNIAYYISGPTTATRAFGIALTCAATQDPNNIWNYIQPCKCVTY